MRLPRSGLQGTNMNPVHPPDQIDMSSSIFTSFCISNMLANTWLHDYDSRLSPTGRFRSTTDGPPIYQLFIHRPLSHSLSFVPYDCHSHLTPTSTSILYSPVFFLHNASSPNPNQPTRSSILAQSGPIWPSIRNSEPRHLFSATSH